MDILGGKVMRPLSIVRRYPLVSFFALAISLTWGIGAVLHGTPIIAPDGNFILALYIAVAIVVGATTGRAGFASLARSIFRWRVSPIWYVIVVALPVLIVGATLGLLSAFGSSPLDWTKAPPPAQMAMLFGLFMVLPLATPIAEEIAWRGVALPRLLAQRSALTSSLILGAMWSIWHLPVVLSSPELRVPVPFMLGILPLSVLCTWVFVNTRASVFVQIVFHALFNVGLLTLAVVDPADAALAWWFLGGTEAVLAVAVVAIFGRELQRSPRENTRAARQALPAAS